MASTTPTSRLWRQYLGGNWRPKSIRLVESKLEVFDESNGEVLSQLFLTPESITAVAQAAASSHEGTRLHAFSVVGYGEEWTMGSASEADREDWIRAVAASAAASPHTADSLVMNAGDSVQGMLQKALGFQKQLNDNARDRNARATAAGSKASATGFRHVARHTGLLSEVLNQLAEKSTEASSSAGGGGCLKPTATAVGGGASLPATVGFHVQMMDGQKHKLTVAKRSTVVQLKYHLEGLFGSSALRQRLFLLGAPDELPSKGTVEEAGLEDGAQVFLLEKDTPPWVSRRVLRKLEQLSNCRLFESGPHSLVRASRNFDRGVGAV